MVGIVDVEYFVLFKYMFEKFRQMNQFQNHVQHDVSLNKQVDEDNCGFLFRDSL